MYSYEIDNYIKSRNSYLTVEEYLFISNISLSSQISHIKYNPYGDYFEIWTKDNYYWSFKVKPIEKNKCLIRKK